MNAADASLIAREPDLPGLALALDPARLESALHAIAPSLLGNGRAEIHRLRYKPQTSVQAAVAIHQPDDATRWLRLVGYRSGAQAKLRKDARTACRRQVEVAAGPAVDAWSVTDPAGDRRLRTDRLDRIAGPWHTLAYNPARRLVVHRSAPEPPLVAKLYGRGQARAASPLVAALRDAGAPVARMWPSPHVELTLTEWVPGRLADPERDGVAVAEAVARIHDITDPIGSPPIDRARLVRRARRGLRFVTAILPSQASAAVELEARLDDSLRTGGHESVGLVHGDLSPDQVIMAADTGRVVLVDLDACGRGPLGWDGATWLAAQAANGSACPVTLPGASPASPLLAAALAIRSPEPFQRRRPGWDRLTGGMIEQALDLLRASRMAPRSPWR